MKRIAYLGTALLLTTTAAWADEPASQSPAPSEAAPPTQSPASVPAQPPAAEVVSRPAQVPLPAPIGLGESTPEPYIGWNRGRRAPMYVNAMFTAGGYGEDGDNRLTTRDSKVLEGVGGVFRIGAVLGPNHRLGGRLQSFIRPTKKILLDPGSQPMPSNQWGAVSFGYIGPEYIYDTGFGLYAGGSLGIAGAFSARALEHDEHHKDPDVERGSAGVAGIACVGYEWRVSKWFAMNAEVFGGLYSGVDDDENGMNGSLFGLAMGVGF